MKKKSRCFEGGQLADTIIFWLDDGYVLAIISMFR